MSRVIVKLEDVYKVYRIRSYEVHALKNVNLEVREGELLIIMGPSGSGKSTLLNIIGTLDRPTGGRVILDGVDIMQLSEDELSYIRCKKVGFVFQFFNLINNFTALENVMLPLVLSGDYTLKEAKEKAIELLRLVGLERFMNNRPSQMSGGQQQRVAIARALANDPSIVLMDEPTGNVDVEAATKILSLINWLNKTYGHTFLVVTHNPDIAAIGTRVLYIRDGILYKEPPKSAFSRVKLLEESADEVRNAYLRMLMVELTSLKRRVLTGKIDYKEARDMLKRLEKKARDLGVVV